MGTSADVPFHPEPHRVPRDPADRERIAALEAENRAVRARLEIASRKYHDINEHTVEWESCPLSCRADRAALGEPQ